MSFSNANAGDKPADPYKQKNLEEDITIQQKVEDLNEFITGCKFGMLTTRDASSGGLFSRCMALATQVPRPSLLSIFNPPPPISAYLTKILPQETGGVDLIFHTNTESGKTDDIASDSHTNISFLNSSGEWASISGTARIITDRAAVKKYYSPALKAWIGDLGDGKHNGGPEDPRIGIIKVEAKSATYAIIRKNAMARGVDLAQGIVTGSAPKVNKLRELSEKEVETWRSSNRMVQ